MDIPNTSQRAPRHDGWTPERKTRFLDSLASKGNVGLACARAGLSREAAYRLRRREPMFARAWKAAQAQARDRSVDVLEDRAIDGIEERIYYRGELIDTRRRFDSRLLLAHIGRLDRIADDEAVQRDVARFDELLACVAGEPVPPDLRAGSDELPVDREQAAERAGLVAEADYELKTRKPKNPAKIAAFHDKCVAAYRRGLVEGAERWDEWFEDACAHVDRATGWCDGEPLPGLPGNPLPAETAAGLEAAAKQPERPLKFIPRTLSTSSTSSLARALAGEAQRSEVAAPRSPFAAAGR